MSADRWTVCPRCDQLNEADLARRRGELAAAYGKVTVEEFDRLRTELAADENRKFEDTWREDWEIGLYDGEIFVSYRGGCGVCNLRKEFEEHHPVEWEGKR